MTEPEMNTLVDRFVDAIKYRVLASADWRFNGRNPMDMFVENLNQTFYIRVLLDALQGTLSERQAQLLAAIQADANEQIDIEALADALVVALPPSVTPDQVTEAVRLAFAKAGGN